MQNGCGRFLRCRCCSVARTVGALTHCCCTCSLHMHTVAACAAAAAAVVEVVEPARARCSTGSAGSSPFQCNNNCTAAALSMRSCTCTCCCSWCCTCAAAAVALQQLLPLTCCGHMFVRPSLQPRHTQAATATSLHRRLLEEAGSLTGGMLRCATRVGVTRLLISRPRACGGALRTASHVGTRALAGALLQAASSPHSASQLLHAVQASNLDRPGPPPAPGGLALRPRSGVPALTAARRLPRSALNLSSASRGWGYGRPHEGGASACLGRGALSLFAPCRLAALGTPFTRIVGSRTQLRPAIRARACRESVPELSPAAAAAAAAPSAAPSAARRGHCCPTSCLLAGL